MRMAMGDFDSANGHDDYLVTSNADYQNTYLSSTLSQAQELGFKFVMFFTLADYDCGHDQIKIDIAQAPTGEGGATITQNERDFLNLYDAWIKTGFFDVKETMDTHSEYTSFTGDLMNMLEPRSSWATWQSWFNKTKN